MKLFDERGRAKYAIDRKFVFLVIGIITFVILLFWYVRTMAKPVIYSCTQLEAAGYHDIKKGSTLYRPQLDRDKDGVACE